MPSSRVWLTTGASSGLGLELAKAAASHGDRVIATTRNNNLSAPTAIDAIIKIHGTVDLVVNNAAYLQTGTVEETSPEETLRQFQANVFGHYRLLVNVATPSCNTHIASKDALRSMVLGMAEEVKQFGIQHMLVEPGLFRTELFHPDTNADTMIRAIHGNQLGDPVKEAEIIYDVVTSSGVAAGLQLPAFMPLGSDGYGGIVKSAQSTIDAVREWEDVAKLSDLPGVERMGFI
ncbi:hypothetical protein F5Y06DRAFT_292413 [Hypoxylon sp. FL0890]|nr:hypothetical protein F5Y06DRAFT_292413 [Hypoxylon sp. FL0890]